MSYVQTAAYDRDAIPETCSEDTHAQGCPCNAGGDIEYRLSYLRCSECGELLRMDGSCVTHGTLDPEQMDLNVEGDPAFNGAFDRW